MAFKWIGRDKHYRINLHRNGLAEYQSSWSGAGPLSATFHCPLIFGTLVMQPESKQM